MRLTEKENETLPIDVSVSEASIHLPRSHFTKTTKNVENCVFSQIVLQTLLSFVMTCYGIVNIAGEFKDMDASSELKTK